VRPIATAVGITIAYFLKISYVVCQCASDQGDQGSMLWSQYSAILANFRQKKIGVFLKNQCYEQKYA
jgi:hypothetical protein